jgi:hypothetical protein
MKLNKKALAEFPAGVFREQEEQGNDNQTNENDQSF